MSKFIWDGLVQAGVIKNDGWNENGGWSNHFEVDSKKPSNRSNNQGGLK